MLYNTEKEQIHGLLHVIDLEKAFDSVSCAFTEKALEQFNFSPGIKIWMDKDILCKCYVMCFCERSVHVL